MEKVTDIYLLGLGRNTPVFIDIAEQAGYTILGLYHYNDELTGEVSQGYPVLGSYHDLLSQQSLKGKAFLLTMGNNDIRQKLAKNIRYLNGETPAIIHPMAVVSRFAQVGCGVVVSPFSYIQAYSKIGDDTIILSHVNISHNNTVGKACFFAGSVVLGAYTQVRNQAFFGIGAKTISDKVQYVGEQAFIGAGALVTADIPDYATVAGIPARVIKINKPDSR